MQALLWGRLFLRIKVIWRRPDQAGWWCDAGLLAGSIWFRREDIVLFGELAALVFALTSQSALASGPAGGEVPPTPS